MALQWSNNLATGVAKIDSQHKELFSNINSLLDAMSKGKGDQEISKVFNFLINYTNSHFGVEETYMQQHSYSDYHAHKSYHETYKNDFQKLKSKVETQGAKTSTVLEVQSFLNNWWMNHIQNVDKKLGSFLQGKI